LDPELQSDDTRDARKFNKRRAAANASLDTADPRLAERGRSRHVTLAEARREPCLVDFATDLTRQPTTAVLGIGQCPPATRHAGIMIGCAYHSVTGGLDARTDHSRVI
jgi:hypothetical protein